MLRCDSPRHNQRKRALQCLSGVWRVAEELGSFARSSLAKEALKREAHWTESLAVGSSGYVERIQPLIVSRREIDLIEEPCGWVLKEDIVPYRAKRA